MATKKRTKGGSKKVVKASKSSVASQTNIKWHGSAQEPPKLEQSTWQLANVIAALLAVMAVMQLASFNDFASGLQELGLPDNAFWPALVILAELWAIAGLLRLKLSPLFRKVSAMMLVGVSGFWFLISITALSRGSESENIGIFGSYAELAPGGIAVMLTAGLLATSLYLYNLVSGE